MKTAVNACLWHGDAKHRNREFEIHTFLQEARDTGHDGVELSDPGALLGGNDKVHSTLRDYGLEPSAFFASATYNPWPPNIEDYQRRLDDAKELGMNMICVCGGFMSNQRRNTLPMDYDMFASSIGPMVEYAEQRDLTIAFHPHRGCVVETLAETREILNRVPALKICVDTGHLEACGDDVPAFIHSLGEQIVYTHIKDYHWGDDTFCPLGEGDGRIDIPACIEALREVGYDGWLTVELDRTWNDGDPSAKEFATRCRNYLAEHCNCPL